ncbi:MAG: hypothetical protein M3083_19130 [Actinomycetota bacterium]|nr:hypothetical protein [Actinomycetota bacterium]MDQ6948928.1 hypothetical protein [Actinomycetota bacterium]
MAELTATPPQLIASGAISAGVVVLFIANLLIALGLPTGTAGNVRLSQFLSPADVAVAAILILAVALVSLVPVPEAANARMLAGIVAAAVVAAGLLRAIVVLTISQEHVAVKLGNMIDALAAVLVAAAAAFWALKPKLLK